MNRMNRVYFMFNSLFCMKLSHCRLLFPLLTLSLSLSPNSIITCIDFMMACKFLSISLIDIVMPVTRIRSINCTLHSTRHFVCSILEYYITLPHQCTLIHSTFTDHLFSTGPRGKRGKRGPPGDAGLPGPLVSLLFFLLLLVLVYLFYIFFNSPLFVHQFVFNSPKYCFFYSFLSFQIDLFL